MKNYEIESGIIEGTIPAADLEAVAREYPFVALGANRSSARLCRTEAEALVERGEANTEKAWCGGSGDGIEHTACAAEWLDGREE